MDYHIAPSHASLLEQQSQQQNNSLTSGRNIYIRSDEDYSRRKDSAKQATRSPDRRRSNQERGKSSSHRDNKSNDNSRKNVNEVARDESRNNSESQSRDRRNDDSRKRKGNGSSMYCEIHGENARHTTKQCKTIIALKEEKTKKTKLGKEASSGTFRPSTVEWLYITTTAS